MNRPDLADEINELKQKNETLENQIYESDKNYIKRMVDNNTHLDLVLRAIAEIESEIEKEEVIIYLAERRKIGRKPIKEELKKYTEAEDIKTVLGSHITANFTGLVDLVIDRDNNVVFLIKDGDALRIEKIWEMNNIKWIPPNKKHLPFMLPRAENVLDYYRCSDDELFQDILQYLKRFSYLSDKHFLIVVCTVFLTYIQDHPDIHYLAMILFYAIPERGKSRTGKAITHIAFRGVHVVDIREANLFRFSQDLKATIFFDLMNLWKKAEKNGAEDILLLRYEKGAKAARVLHPDKGPFEDMKHFDVSGPTFIATNEAVHRILDSRCIPITMPNKPGDYENPTPEKGIELKERLTAWRGKILDKSLPMVEKIEGLNGRLWDISKPLLQICKLVYPQRLEDLKDTLLEIAGQRTEDKKDSIEGQIISILYDLSPEGIFQWNIQTSDVLDKLNLSRPETHKLTPQYIGKRLKAMGLSTRKVHGYSEIILSLQDFNILLTQYGYEIISTPTPEKTLPNSTILPQQAKSREKQVESQVESAGLSTQLSTHETRINTGQGSLVESGREFPEGEENIISDMREVVI